MTSPRVQYAYANRSANHIRSTPPIYASGRELNYNYGSADSLPDAASRLVALLDDDGSTHLTDYSYLGRMTFVETDYSEPEVKYTLVGTDRGTIRTLGTSTEPDLSSPSTYGLPNVCCLSPRIPAASPLLLSRRQAMAFPRQPTDNACMACRVIFLDRDGTINVDHGYVHRIEDWEFIPGAIEAIRDLRSAGYTIAVVSNQSAIGAGKYSQDDVGRLHDFLLSELVRHATTIDAIAICPHTSDDDCDCRKPRPGLAREVEQQLGDAIDYAASWTIGDKPSDIGFGRAIGTRTILLRSRYWQASDLQLQPDYVADSLQAASSVLTCSMPEEP